MLSRDWLKAFLPVGVMRQVTGDARVGWQPVGAGTIVEGDGVLWFVTAAHVIRQHPGPFVLLVPARAGTPGPIPLNLTATQAQTGTAWVFAEQHDLAATLMPLAPTFDVRAVARELFLGIDGAVPSMPCFTVGCPHGVLVPGRSAPLVQDGVVSGVGDGDLIYTTAPTFPGNSGGPLLVVRVPYTTGGAITVGGSTVFFAGVMSQYALFRAEGAEHAPLLPALHLGVAVSADAVAALLDSPECKAQEDLAKRNASA